MVSLMTKPLSADQIAKLSQDANVVTVAKALARSYQCGWGAEKDSVDPVSLCWFALKLHPERRETAVEVERVTRALVRAGLIRRTGRGKFAPVNVSPTDERVLDAIRAEMRASHRYEVSVYDVQKLGVLPLLGYEGEWATDAFQRAHDATQARSYLCGNPRILLAD